VWVLLLQGRVEHEWTQATPCFRPYEDLKDVSLTGFSDNFRISLYRAPALFVKAPKARRYTNNLKQIASSWYRRGFLLVLLLLQFRTSRLERVGKPNLSGGQATPSSLGKANWGPAR
jgi:hypothetical protein